MRVVLFQEVLKFLSALCLLLSSNRLTENLNKK